MEQEVKVGDKTYVVKEIKYKDVVKFSETDKVETSKQIMILSTGMTEEQYEDLSMKEGIEIMNAVNKLNGLNVEDFQTPTQTKE